MSEDHIRHCLQYEFDKGSSAKLALKNIQQTYGNESLSDSVCRQLFKKFRSEKSSLSVNDDDEEEEGESENKALIEDIPAVKHEKAEVIPPPKKMARRAAAGPKLHEKPPIVKSGFKFTDNQKNEYSLGKEIGTGGFGRIYEAKQLTSGKQVAVKMEPMMNGPLFTEMHIYLKLLKEQQLAQFKKNNGIQFLGLPSLISSGRVTYEGEELRYLIIPKYEDSVEAALKRTKTCFTMSQVQAITSCVLYAFQYMHSENYVHADVKASNLLMEKKNDFEHSVLIDFGLARKLPDVLVEKEDKKSAHNGTIEFTSCDAHRGCLPSYRGDLEILTHNMLYWLTSSLPWEDEKDPVAVFQAKKSLIENVEKELPPLIKSQKTMSVVRYFYKVVRKMQYTDRIDFKALGKALDASISSKKN